MSDFESRLTETLRERSHDVAGTSLPVGGLVRRARRRRALTVSAAVAGLVGIVFSGVALSTIDGDHTSRDIAGPANATPYAGHPAPFDTTDDPSTERIEVATGERSGLPWVLYLERGPAHHDDPGARDVWCLGFAWDGDGSGCPVSMPDGKYVLAGRQGGGGNPEDTLFGELAPEVARVEIRING